MTRQREAEASVAVDDEAKFAAWECSLVSSGWFELVKKTPRLRS
jgi:hypothetical protein